jgi:hypothetical protein
MLGLGACSLAIAAGCSDDDDDGSGCSHCSACDDQLECIEAYQEALEGVPDDPETQEPYNWDDYCADGFVSDEPSEIYFCDTMWRLPGGAVHEERRRLSLRLRRIPGIGLLGPHADGSTFQGTERPKRASPPPRLKVPSTPRKIGIWGGAADVAEDPSMPGRVSHHRDARVLLRIGERERGDGLELL